MDAGNTLSARRDWIAAERRADRIQVAEPPTLGEIFKQGFLRGSMLQMAVCTPPRQATTRKYEAVFVTALGGAARKARAATDAVEA